MLSLPAFRIAIFTSYLLALASGAAAQVLTWDTNGATPGSGGSGTWDTATAVWTPDGIVFQTWNNAAGDSAIFDGAAGTVTVSGSITVQSLQFLVPGYLVTGGSLTLTGSSVLTVSGDTTIGSTLLGGGFTKVGAGILTLSGANAYTGDTVVDQGVLRLADASALPGGIGSSGGAGSLLTLGTLSTSTGVLGIAADFSRPLTTTPGVAGVQFGGSGGFAAFGGDWTVSFGGTTAAVTWGSGSFVPNGSTLIFGDAGADGTVIVANGISLGSSNRTIHVNNGSAVIDAILDGDLTGAGGGGLTKTGAGTLAVTGTASYTGGTTISAGTLQVGNGGTSGALLGTIDIASGATLALSRSDSALAIPGVISGAGTLRVSGTGTVSLTGTNSYTGPTQVASGTLQVGNGGLTGSLGTGVVGLSPNTTLVFNRSNDLTITNSISGGTNANLVKNGAGTLTFSGFALLAGTTSVNAGGLLVTGTLGSPVGVASGATLGGTGSIGGTASLASGATLAPGAGGVGTLNLSGLVLDAATLSFDLGEANVVGGSFNDLVVVSGDVQLNGATVVNVIPGGTFATVPGSYRLINYGGALIGSGSIVAGSVPGYTGPGQATIQTSVGGQVNLIVATFATNFWDGSNPTPNGVVDGGNGTWNLSATNWTDAAGTTNAAYVPGLAVFGGTPGIVLLGENVSAHVLQFTTDNYTLGGPSHTLTLLSQDGAGGTTPGLIRVDAGVSAFISAPLGGTVGLEKADAGLLALVGANTYTGGTTISGGELQVGRGGTTGALGAGAVLNNGRLSFARSDTITVADAITGSGSVGVDQGVVVFTGTNTYTGGTTISSGELQVGQGGIAGSIVGSVHVGAGATLVFNRSDSVTFAGGISGPGALTQAGTGTLILTGANTYGGTVISPGTTLQVGNGGTTGTLGSGNVANDGTLVFDRSNELFVVGGISGTGGVSQVGTGKTILIGANTYTGGTTVTAGELQIGDGGTMGTLGTGAVVNSSRLSFNRSDIHLTVSNDISGTGSLYQLGSGMTTLTGTNTYSGDTYINFGTLVVGAGGATGTLGTGPVVIDGVAVLTFSRNDTYTVSNEISGTGTLTVASGTAVLTGTNTYTGDTVVSSTLQLGSGGTTGSIVGGGTVTVNVGATLMFNRSDAVTFNGVITSTGAVSQVGAGTTTLTGANHYTGTTTISAGGLQIGNGGTTGTLGTGAVTNAATLTFNRSNALTVANAISGGGTIVQVGTGTTTLSGTVSAASVAVNAGTVLVTGTTTAPVTVASGATLGGTGVLVGATTVGPGATLAPGANGVGVLTLGDLALTVGSTLAMDLGAPNVIGGPLNDRVQINGNLSLGATTLNINDTGAFATTAGSYRLIDYSGTLTGSAANVTLGTLPGVPPNSAVVQTAVAGQVNLIVTNGLAANFWDGPNTTANGAVDGGAGTWNNSLANWTDASGAFNRAYVPGLAVFAGVSGIVLLGEDVSANAIQFTTAGYAVNGGGHTLTLLSQAGAGGTTPGLIRVDAGVAATIAAPLAGTLGLEKADAGTLVLTGFNTYTGGTTISGGTLQLGNGGTTGFIVGDVAVQAGATLAFDYSSAGIVPFAGAVSGAGSLTVDAAGGAVVLTGTNTHTGGTTVLAGTLRIGNAGTTGSIVGDVLVDSGAILEFDRSDTVTFPGVVSGAGALWTAGLTGRLILTGTNTYTGQTALLGTSTLQIGNGGTTGSISSLTVTGGGTLAFNRSDTVTFAGSLGDIARLAQVGNGTTILTGTNTYTGVTTISAGTLQVGAGGTTGTLGSGAVGNDAALVFNRSDTVLYFNQISGTGTVTQAGSGQVYLGGASTYTGATTVSAGTLIVGGSVTSPVTVASGATLGGAGTIGGSATIAAGATLAPGNGGQVGVLTLGGLDLQAGSLLAFQLGEPNVIGGAFNDRLQVNGNLTVGGTTLSVTDANVFTSTPGSYRLIDYTGTLTGSAANVTLGTLPGVPPNGAIVQTAVAGQVNLIVTNGLAANFWDGPNTTANGAVDGGAGTWNNSLANWTDASGAFNRAYVPGLAVFAGTAGIVLLGEDVSANVLQFTTAGYTVAGGGHTLTLLSQAGAGGTTPGLIRVDATAARISAPIAGSVGLEKTGTGHLTLDGTNTYTGGTTISAGTLQVGNGGTSGTLGGGDVLNNGQLVFDRSDTITVDNAISGTGGLHVGGLGTVILTATNTFTGGTVTTTTLQIGAGGTTGSIVGDVANFGGTLIFNRSDAVTFGGFISGSGALTQAGTGVTTLTGNHTYTGGTTITAGTLQLGAGGTTGSLVGNVVNNGTLSVNRSNDLTFSGVISGTGGLVQAGAGALTLTGTNTYTGGTTISAGTLQVGDGGTTGTLGTGAVTNNGALTFNRSDSVTFGGVVSGTGTLTQAGTGTTVLTADNTYTGTTTINAGTLQIGDGGATGAIGTGAVVNDGTLRFNRTGTLTVAGAISGSGSLIVTLGTTILTGTNSYTGSTTLTGSALLVVGDGGATGTLGTGPIANAGVLRFNRSGSLTVAGAITGGGAIGQLGTGTTTLSGPVDSSAIIVAAGGLFLNGTTTAPDVQTLSASTVLGGSGTISGTVVVAGTLAPGAAPGTVGTLTMGGLDLQTGSSLAFDLGAPNVIGGPLNDRLQVNGNLTIGGTTLNVTDTGAFATTPGSYRLIDYTGTLTGTASNFVLGTLPGIPPNSAVVQTAVAGQVNLIVSGGLATNFWDGPNTTGDAVIAGGTGTWNNSLTNWTNAAGTINQAYVPGLAIFAGAAGTVTLGENVSANVLQFTTSGYTVAGGGHTLTLLSQDGPGGTTPGLITVDSGNATISAPIAGTVGLQKSGNGFLALAGANTYTGGTTISAGTLVVTGTSATLGAGAVVNNGQLTFDPVSTYVFSEDITGSGVLRVQSGVLVLTGASSLSSLSFAQAGGTLQIGNGGTTGSFVGTLQVDGALVFNRSDTVTHASSITGTGTLTQAGAGALVLTGTNVYSGGTTISAGTLRIGAGGTSGTLGAGAVTNAGSLIFNRSDVLTVGNAISGTGALTQAGTGTTVLTGTNTYTGATNITAGTLQIGNGGTTGTLGTGNVSLGAGTTLAINRADAVTIGNTIIGPAGRFEQNGPGTTTLTAVTAFSQASVTAGTLLVNNVMVVSSPVQVLAGAMLGGTGALASADVQAGGTLAPGAGGPGTLTISSALTLAAGSTLAFDLGAPNVVGGPLNDRLQVNGNLTIGGTTLNVTDTGAFATTPGSYRLIDYTGTLTGSAANVTLGTLPGVPPNSAVVQTAVAGQVNLIVSFGLAANFWDGPNTSANGAVDGGTGTWNNSLTNWTNTTGTINQAYLPGLAIFSGAAGTVTLGEDVTVQLMQFAVDGYTVAGAGHTINLQPVIANAVARVDTGTATIGATLAGTTALGVVGPGTLILTGANTYTGGTAVGSGTLQLGNGGTTGSILGDVAINAGATLAFNRSDLVTFDGVISDAGAVVQAGTGRTILTGTNTYTGGTTISAGILQLGNGLTTGSIVGDVLNNGTLAFDRSDVVPFSGVISGTGHVSVTGGGDVVLTGASTYTGNTTIANGRLVLGDGGTTGSIVGNVSTFFGSLVFNRSDTVTFPGVISGGGFVVQAGTGTTILTGDNTFATELKIDQGTVQLGAGGTTGSITAGSVQNLGALVFNRSDTVTYAGNIFGTGTVRQAGPGTTILTGTNTYTGPTQITAGTLQIGDGGTSGTLGTGTVSMGPGTTLAINRSDAVTIGNSILTTGRLEQNGTGTTTLTAFTAFSQVSVTAGTLLVNNAMAVASPVQVLAGATLGGTGGLGSAAVQAGGTLAPGAGGPGTLTITGDLSLANGSLLAFDLGAPNVVGGSLNDRLQVDGNLTIGGTTLNVTDTGAFATTLGSYRLIDYTGTLTGSAANVTLGTLPGVPPNSAVVQTAVAGQVNLIVSGGLAANFWDGPNTTGDGVIAGGTGTWNNSLPNWTNATGTINQAYLPGLAIFTGAPGTVTLGEDVTVQLMQFAVDGYTVAGAGHTINLQPVIANAVARVDTGTATIGATLAGTTTLGVVGPGTLILTGTNTYTGGTAVGSGTLQLGDGGTTGSIVGDVAINAGATLAFNRSDDVTFGGVISDNGAVVQAGTGTTELTGTNTYTGGTTISAGTLRLGNGGTTGSIVGDVAINSGATLNFARTDSVTFGGVISGNGHMSVQGGGDVVLTAANTYTGNTTIGNGRLVLGNGGTTGSIVGNVNTFFGSLVFNRSDTVTFGGVISGGGFAVQAGTGTTILTGDNTFFAELKIEQGTVQLGAGGTTGSITAGSVQNLGALIFNRSDTLTYDGDIFGTGSVTQAGTGTTELTGTNTYTGGTTISAGTLRLGNGGTTGSIVGDVAINSGATLNFDRTDSVTFGGVISGNGHVSVQGGGDVVLTAANTYTGNTTIANGRLVLGDGGTTGSIVGNVNTFFGSLVFNRADTVTFPGVISGGGFVVQAGTGTTILTGDNTFFAELKIEQGTVQLGAGGTTGSITAGSVQNLGALIFNRSDTVTYAGDIFGTGTVTQAGTGTTVLTGTNTYTGATTVSAGTLSVEGSLTSPVTVNSGAALAGTGTIGGAVTIASGATLTPGASGTGIGTLTTGDLTLASGSVLAYQLGQPNIFGGPLNDLVNVNGNLTVAGTTVNVTDSGQFATLPGLYRLANYTGTLAGTASDFTVGTTPGYGAGQVIVQTSVPGEVNLITAPAGVAAQFWDGVDVIANNAIDGGPGTFDNALTNWTDANGAGNTGWLGGIGIFQAPGGVVTLGADISAQALLFVGDGYVVQGAGHTITLAPLSPAGPALIAVDAGETTTFNVGLAGATPLFTGGAGTTVLTQNNTYTGGTVILGGTLQLGAGGTSGSLTSDVTNNGTLAFNRSDTHTFANVISGPGAVQQIGSGTTILTGANTYTGTTTISAGTLQIGNGGASGTIGTGAVVDNGTLAFNRSDVVTMAGVISGTGALQQNGTGTTILTGTNTYSGTTTINAGTLQLGDGGAVGTIGSGAVINNAALTFDHANTLLVNNTISGSGALTQAGTGTTTLAGAVSAGSALVAAGRLLVTGSMTVPALTVASGATLGGTGSISGSVTVNDGGTIAPGLSPGTLTVGSLLLSDASILDYELGPAGTIGGGVNDLIEITGSLTLDGVLNVTALSGFGAGGYRLMNYGGALIDNGAVFGALPVGFAYTLQTSVANQVNLVVGTPSASQTVQYWDGRGLAGNGVIDGGIGTWTNGPTNWTNATGAVNQGWNGGTAVFTGTPGTINVVGPVNFSALQFQASGYALNAGAGGQLVTSNFGTPIDLGGNTAVIGAPITGPGGLDISGGGMLVLAANNSYTGGTRVKTGTTLEIGNGGNTGGIVGPITTDGLLGFNRSDVHTVSNPIDGTGQLRHDGSGTTVLTGLNAYTGGTILNNGILSVSSNGNLGGPSGGLTFNGGTLQTTATMTAGRATALNGNGTIDTAPATTFNHNGPITGTGGLIKTGGGTLVLGAANSYSGGTLVSAGTLQGTTTSLQGTIIDNAALVFAQPSNGTFNGTLFGTGTMTKTEGGTLRLTGNHGLSGLTTVAGGTLALEGSLAGSVAVNSGTTFNGNGVLGGTLNVSGQVGIINNPDGSYGQLGVVGNIQFNAGSTYVVGLNPDGKNSTLVTNGSASVTGMTVRVDPTAGTYGRYTAYPVLGAQQGVTGTAGVTTSSTLIEPFLTYSPNTLFVSLFNLDVRLQPFATTGSGWGVGGAVDLIKRGASGDLREITRILTALPDDQLARALDAIAGEIHASKNQLAVLDGDSIMDAMRAELTLRIAQRGGLSGATLATAPSLWGDRRRFWFRVRGERSSFDDGGTGAGIAGRTAAHGGDASLEGVALGVDWTKGAHWLAGVGAAYANGRMSINDLNERATFDAPRAMGHLGYSRSRWAVDLGGSVAYMLYEVERSFAFAAYGPDGRVLYQPVNRTAVSTPRGPASELWLEPRYNWLLGAWDVQPTAALRGAWYHLNDWQETGADSLSLSGPSQTVTSLKADGGLRLSRARGRLRPFASGLYRRELLDGRNEAILQLGPTADGLYRLNGIGLTRDMGIGQLGLQLLRNRFGMSITYQIYASKPQTWQSLQLGVSF